jgi:quinol-cytochrome oxidoreductase complex cytochrome b subunit
VVKARPRCFPLVVLAMMAGLAVATEDVAGALHFPREFGPGLADIGPVRIYPPWVFADWLFRFQRNDPQAFVDASLWGGLAALVMVTLAIVVGASRRKKGRSPTDHIVKETTMPTQPAQPAIRAWRNVLPAAAPGCSQGTPYSFWVKRAT